MRPSYAKSLVQKLLSSVREKDPESDREVPGMDTVMGRSLY